MRQLFGTDGIRGQANCYPVTPEIALKIGKTVGSFFINTDGKPSRVVIGKDTRLSGYMLETALTSGLVSAGMTVLLVGPLPTPAVAHLTRSMNACVGIMLTASHNPYDDNGIKLFDSCGFKLDDRIEEEIEDRVLNNPVNNDHVRSHKLGKAYRIDDARGRYIEFAKSTAGNKNLEGLKVVLDCSHGAGYLIGPWIYEELGAEVIKINAEPDGYNINNGCGALHPENVAAVVKKEGAELGIALDGDADRAVFVDENGEHVDGDKILALCAADFKKKNLLKNDTLVVTSMSNLGLHEAMHQLGITVEVTDVGDRQVIERMRSGDYNLGGEKSGHIIFMDYATTGDGIISGLQVLRIMQENNKPMSVLAECMREYPQQQKSLKVNEKIPLEQLPELTKVIRQCEQELGEDGRVIVRYSGTETKIRFLVEAACNEQVEECMDRLLKTAENELAA